MAKLYDEDEDNLFREEMNVFDMGNDELSDKEAQPKKRADKEQSKGEKKGSQVKSKAIETSKINRLVSI